MKDYWHIALIQKALYVIGMIQIVAGVILSLGHLIDEIQIGWFQIVGVLVSGIIFNAIAGILELLTDIANKSTPNADHN